MSKKNRFSYATPVVLTFSLAVCVANFKSAVDQYSGFWIFCFALLIAAGLLIQILYQKQVADDAKAQSALLEKMSKDIESQKNSIDALIKLLESKDSDKS